MYYHDNAVIYLRDKTSWKFYSQIFILFGINYLNGKMQWRYPLVMRFFSIREIKNLKLPSPFFQDVTKSVFQRYFCVDCVIHSCVDVVQASV